MVVAWWWWWWTLGAVEGLCLVSLVLLHDAQPAAIVLFIVVDDLHRGLVYFYLGHGHPQPMLVLEVLAERIPGCFHGILSVVYLDPDLLVAFRAGGVCPHKGRARAGAS